MKNLINILLILISINLYSQTPNDNCYDPQWDWTKKENWLLYFSNAIQPDGTYLGVEKYPFNNGEMGADFIRILENNDLSPDDGWVLLQKNFGCQTYSMDKPYVIFYNYYRGVIRVFAFHTYLESASYGLMTAEWVGGNRTSALTHSNVYARANDKYPDYNNDMVMIQMEDYVKGKWWVGEFQVAFDHKTKSDQNGYNLMFRVYNVINSDIEFTSKVDLATKSLEVKGEKDKKEGSTNNEIRDWAVEGQKAIQKLSYDEWDDYLKKTQEGALEVYDWARNEWLENNTYEWLETASAWTYNAVKNEYLGEILTEGANFFGDINSTLGFVVDFIDFFAGKPSKSSSPSLVQLAPLQITGTITSTGKIKTTTQQDFFPLQLPGTNVDYPYYTCPLGVLNLKETPELDLRKWDVTNKKLYSLNKTNIYKETVNEYGTVYTKYHCSQTYDYGQPVYDEETVYWVNRPCSSSDFKPTEKWKSIRLKDNLSVVLNSAANLELVEAKVAFQGKIKRKSADPTSTDYNKGAYNPFEQYQLLPDDINDYRIYRPTYACEGKCDDSDIGGNSLAPGTFISSSAYINTSDKWLNYTFDKLKNKTYLVIEGGEDLGDNKRNEFYKFRTGFVDIKEAQNLSFTVREETEVTLKILAVLKEIDDDDAPLMVFTSEYDLDEQLNETDPTNSSYPFIRNQLSNVDIYQGSNEFTLIENQNISSGTYSNGKIETSGSVNVNASSNVSFTANHSIVLKPGFSISSSSSASFTAKIENGSNIINSSAVSLAQVAKYYWDGDEYDYPVPCSCMPQMSTLKSASLNNQLSTNQLIETSCEIFPSPCQDLLNIDYLSAFEGLSDLSIFDLNGRVVFQKKISSGFQRLNLSHIKPGLYVLRINNGIDNINKKIIKE